VRVLILIATLLSASLSLEAGNALAHEDAAATVDGKQITGADLRLAERELGARLTLAPEERRRLLLEILIEREVLATEAERARLHIGKDFEQRLAYARRRVLQQLLLEKHAKENATEAEAKRIYGEQSAAAKPEESRRAVPPFPELKGHILRILARNKTRELARTLRDKAEVVYLDPALKPLAAASATKTEPGTAPGSGTPTVREVFEKYNLFGVFTRDCTKPPSKDNPYFVNRLIDDSHAQRDFMTDPMTREWSAIIDKAVELTPDKLTISGTLNGQDAEGIWRIETNGVQQLHVKLAGKTIIDDGRATATGSKVPLFNKCAEAADPKPAAMP
jgi:hypothetical protein